MKESTIDKLVAESMAIEAESAKEAGTIGYMARAMVQATLPHSETKETQYERRNGNYRLTIAALLRGVGLPYGALPRLMLAWIGTEVTKKKEQEIDLGNNMSDFMRELGMAVTGGENGSIARMKDQAMRLTSCAISCSYMDESDGSFDSGESFKIGRGQLWWNTDTPHEFRGMHSTLILSNEMYREILDHPVPIDMRVMQMLKRSPMAMDVYNWITYRIFTLNHSKRPSVTIPWESLQLQFGAGYPTTSKGNHNFRKGFIDALVKVRALAYKDANISYGKEGLTLNQSPLHLPRKRLRKPHE